MSKPARGSWRGGSLRLFPLDVVDTNIGATPKSPNERRISVPMLDFCEKSFSDGEITGLEGVRRRIHTYQSDRVRDEQQFVNSAIHFGCSCLVLGLGTAVTGSAFELLLEANTTVCIIRLIGSGLFLVGVFILTLCPHEAHGKIRALSFDGSMRENHGVWTTALLLVVLLGALSLVGKISIPWVSPTGSIPALLGLALGKSVHVNGGRAQEGIVPESSRLDGECSGVLPFHKYPSTFVVAILLLTLAGHGVVQIGTSVHSEIASQINEDRCTSHYCYAYLVAGVFRLLSSIIVFVVWLRYRQRALFQQNDDSNRTKALFIAIYAYMLCTGIGSFITAVGLGVHKWRDIFDGIIWLTLPIMIFVLGYRRSLRLVRPFFEKKRAKQDGAFIAELLDTVMVPPGGTWYVLREEPSECYGHGDFRKYWRRGTVDQIGRESMVVSVTRRRRSVDRSKSKANFFTVVAQAVAESKIKEASQAPTRATEFKSPVRTAWSDSRHGPHSPRVKNFAIEDRKDEEEICKKDIIKIEVGVEKQEGMEAEESPDLTRERAAHLWAIFRAAVHNGGVERIRNQNEGGLAMRSRRQSFLSMYSRSPSRGARKGGQASFDIADLPEIKTGKAPQPRRGSFRKSLQRRSSFLKPMQRRSSFRTSGILVNRRQSGSESDLVDEKVTINIASQKNSDELLKEAEANLRCIAWEDIDRNLMESSSSDLDDFNRSRALRRGEKIDFFMSHSWNDEPELKFAALERVVARFKRRNGRSPTFWFDKVCIDQSKIIDGLKVLPINIAACNKVLVLCGDTYPRRLWCVWELFTLFAFSEKEHARAKIEFEPVREGAGEEALSEPVADYAPSDVPESLKHFHLARAHCFDPNEENRLRGIIEARGVDVFEGRIRDLALQCEIAISESKPTERLMSRSRRGWKNIRSAVDLSLVMADSGSPSDRRRGAFSFDSYRSRSSVSNTGASPKGNTENGKRLGVLEL